MSRQLAASVVGAVFIRDLELLHPKIMQQAWKGSPPFHISSHPWVRRVFLCQKLNQTKSGEGGRRRLSSALARPEKDMLEKPTEEGPDSPRRIKQWYTVRSNQSPTWQHAAPRSAAPALCVHEAVVRQLQHDPAQAVMTAVGNCYVSVPFRSLQE